MLICEISNVFFLLIFVFAKLPDNSTFWDKVQVQVFSWYEGNQEMDNFNKNFSQLFGKVLT